MRKFLMSLAVAALVGCVSPVDEAKNKNVILIIVDGAGFGSWQAAAMYEGRDVAMPLLDSPQWQSLASTTYSLKGKQAAGGIGVQDKNFIYSPARFRDVTPDPKHCFAGYRRAKKYKTDSAAAGTALSSGVKTYNGGINWADDSSPIVTLSQVAKENGKAVGVVTTVQISHATPATMGAGHNIKRTNYQEISDEMLNAGVIDLWMGGGHPEFDPDGKILKKRDYKYVGGKKNWDAIRKGNHSGAWKLIENRADFQKLMTAQENPGRVLGVFKSSSCTQYDRAKGTPLRTDVPTLAEMSLGAMNVLNRNYPDGFWLGIEAGAPDWANHANNFPRLIEEMQDMFDAVDSICRRLDCGADGLSWDNTVVVITADHETGLLLGEKSKTVAFDPIRPAGKGVLPKHVYHSTDHSNYPVPLYIRGQNAAKIRNYIRAADPVYGPYTDNIDINNFMRECFGYPRAQ